MKKSILTPITQFVLLGLLVIGNVNAKEKEPSICKNEELAEQDLPEWSILTFIQADNDLHPFADFNVNGMQDGMVKTNKINKLVQWDDPAHNKTMRYKVESGRRIDQNSFEVSEMGFNPQEEIVDSVAWMVDNFPAKRYGLVLWNHGSGIEDLSDGFTTHIRQMAKPKIFKSWMQLPGMPWVDKKGTEFNDRGILYDYTQGTYLSNQGLTAVMSQIKAKIGKKIDVVGMDACYMGMHEICCQINQYADYLVGSEEFEPGEGWAYQYWLRDLTQNPTMTPAELAHSIVTGYARFYRESHVSDYTQSAIRLDMTDELTQNINEFAMAFEEYSELDSRRANNIKTKARKASIEFGMPQYIDLYSFYNEFAIQAKSLQRSLEDELELSDDSESNRRMRQGRLRRRRRRRRREETESEKRWKEATEKIVDVIDKGKIIIENMVVSNAVGQSHHKAKGVAIYYPYGDPMHESYEQTEFWKNSLWRKIIKSESFLGEHVATLNSLL